MTHRDHPDTPISHPVPGGAQTLLELWQLQGCAHSLGTLWVEEPFPKIHPKPALEGLQPFWVLLTAEVSVLPLHFSLWCKILLRNDSRARLGRNETTALIKPQIPAPVTTQGQLLWAGLCQQSQSTWRGTEATKAFNITEPLAQE